METTGRALVDHWAWAIEKGLMNKNTAASLRSACKRVLDVEDDWQSVDVKKLDVEGILTRFQNLRAKKYKPNVLETYKRRFRQAVRSYLEYLEDPAGWKPSSSSGPTRTRNQNGAEAQKEPVPRGEVVREVVPGPKGAGLVDYPFPIREGLIARLVLPRDLKTSEVKRLSAFMTTLALDFDGEKLQPEHR